jgi:hypothetical protein
VVEQKERKTYRHGYPMKKRRHVELFIFINNWDKLPFNSTGFDVK